MIYDKSPMQTNFEYGGYHALGVLDTLEKQMGAAVSGFKTDDPFSRLHTDIRGFLNLKYPVCDFTSQNPYLHPGDLLPVAQKLWAAWVGDILGGNSAGRFRVFPASRLDHPCEPPDRSGKLWREWDGYPLDQLYSHMEARQGEMCIVEGCVPGIEYERICQELVSFMSPFSSNQLLHVTYLLAAVCAVLVENVVVSYKDGVVLRLPSPSLVIQRQAVETGARVVFTNDFLDGTERRFLLREGYIPVPLSYFTLSGPVSGLSHMTLGNYTHSMHPLYALYLGVWNMKLETQW